MPVMKSIDVFIEYTGNAEENEPQDVQIYIDDMNHDITDLYYADQITKNTTVTIDLTIAPGTAGAYKIIVNGTVVQEKMVPYE